MEELESLDRTELMNRWAEIVLAGKEAGHIKAEAAAAVSVAYDIEWEKQKALMQASQWEQEMEERRAQRELETRRFEAELAERQAARDAEARRLEADAAERQAAREIEIKRLDAEAKRREEKAIERRAFQEKQLSLQHRQVALMEDKDRVEKEAEKGRVKMLKNYGDVLRNTVVKLGNDVIDFIPFCDNIEKQFKELKVPSELRVSLLKPFLNERAQLLVSRLDAERQDDYDYVKQYLLDQFRLVPQYFLEMFNSVCRQSNDTYKSFISRLSLLLDYYLSSRKVKTFDELKQLLISDRVKATLPEGPLNHLLKVEAVCLVSTRCRTKRQKRWIRIMPTMIHVIGQGCLLSA
jgi:hypothetical protein